MVSFPSMSSNFETDYDYIVLHYIPERVLSVVHINLTFLLELIDRRSFSVRSVSYDMTEPRPRLIFKCILVKQ